MTAVPLSGCADAAQPDRDLLVAVGDEGVRLHQPRGVDGQARVGNPLQPAGDRDAHLAAGQQVPGAEVRAVTEREMLAAGLTPHIERQRRGVLVRAMPTAAM